VASYQTSLRPDGEVLWLHATTQERYLALCDAGHRLKSMRPDLMVIATWEDDMGTVPPVEGCDLAHGVLPPDQSAAAKRFLNHWRPDLCLWAGGGLRRNMLRQMREMQISALLVDILDDEMPERKMRWLPDQRYRMFSGFEQILTPSPTVRAQLIKSGIHSNRVKRVSSLGPATMPPGCNADELGQMQKDLGGRPVWLAAQAQLEEVPFMLEGHRGALRLLHRLLLILTLDSEDSQQRAKSLIQASGLQCADWDSGELPDDYTQVLVAGPEELGLWYRLAPVTLMGGSLFAHLPGQSPLDALALGSVALHGPGTGLYKSSYHHLDQAGATAPVRNSKELSRQIIQLSSPDKAAEMALAGWKAVTAGAEMTDQLIELVQDILDMREESHAAP